MSELATSFSSLLSAEILERPELVALPGCPFSLPSRDDLTFLTQQRTAKYRHKDIYFNPNDGQIQGCREKDVTRRDRVRRILSSFSDSVDSWLRNALPAYASGLVKDRATLRTREEATRALRVTARNDLLHIDNFPTRPTYGRRILRVFVNIHPTENQVWAVSEDFRQLLKRYSEVHKVPIRTMTEWLAPATSMLSIFGRRRDTRSAYDAWMLRLHHFLKQDLAFQSLAARKVINFAPSATWLLFSDGLAHAHLRGRFVLEHSFFVDSKCLVAAAESPIAILAALGEDGRQAPAKN